MVCKVQKQYGREMSHSHRVSSRTQRLLRCSRLF